MYSEAVGVVGVAVSKFIFGMFGLFSYAIPVAFVAGGILLIVNAKDNFHKSSIVLAVIGLWLIVGVIHIATRPSISNVDFLKYGNDAYLLGQTLHKGGGIFGAIPAWPALYLLGEAGAYIFFIAAFIIIVLVITKISLRSAGKKVGTQIKKGIDTISAAAEEHRGQRQSLYTEDLEAEQTKLDFAEHQPVRKRQAKSKPAAPEKKSVAADTPVKTKKEWDGDIDFIPTSGPIERQKKNASVVNEEDPFGFESLFVPDPEPVVSESEVIPVAFEEEPPVNYAERITQFVQAPETEPVQEELPVFKSTAEPVEAIPKKTEKVTEVENIEPMPAAAAVYQRPPFNLLNAPKLTYSRGGDTPEEKAKLLLDTLASFNITAKLLNISVGPVITRYELQPAQGIRVNRITALADDLALALAAPRVRIEAPIPGKAAIGIEVPNRDTATVLLREIIESKEFMSSKSSITFALGKDIAGNIAIADLDRMPHLLIAGATGSGKSVCINDIIISMIYKSSPADLRLILVDPKVVELRMFSVLPHLLVPVVTEPKKAAGALRWAVMEMEERYKKMAKLNVRSLAGYNAIQENPQDKMPKLVIIIDELADLMMVASKDVEESI
ncbi:MAG: DNA translocase FtsK, partial [Clostridia bacterium]|nr:DNA translocase FtsK [Clostridia bacterium]